MRAGEEWEHGFARELVFATSQATQLSWSKKGVVYAGAGKTRTLRAIRKRSSRRPPTSAQNHFSVLLESVSKELGATRKEVAHHAWEAREPGGLRSEVRTAVAYTWRISLGSPVRVRPSRSWT
jgi:hypothetical protein